MGRTRRPSADGTATSEPSGGFDLFSPGTGMSLVGLGLLALAAVEAAALLRPSLAPTPTSSVRSVPIDALGLLSPMTTAEVDAAADPQNAVGTGPAAPKVRDKGTAPAPSGSVIGIAATPIPTGTALYRLW